MILHVTWSIYVAWMERYTISIQKQMGGHRRWSTWAWKHAWEDADQAAHSASVCACVSGMCLSVCADVCVPCVWVCKAVEEGEEKKYRGNCSID